MNRSLIKPNILPISRSALDLLWQPTSLFAILCIGELIAAILALAPGNNFERWVYFGLASIVIQWVALLTISFIYLFREQLLKLSLNSTAWLCLAIFVLNAFLFSLIAWKILQLDSFQAQSMWDFSFSMALIAFLIGLMSLAVFQSHWKSRQYALKSKQAQLDALHARIKPHFLFNTLNSLAALIPKNPQQAENLLFNLVDLFRAALSNETEVDLSTELATTKQYLEIEEIRFGDRLRIDWQLPTVIPNIMLPALCLQPLAENAIKHGVSQNPDGGSILIRVESLADYIKIQVCNSFEATSEAIDTSGFKIGLQSTKERIDLMSDGLNQLDTFVRDGQFIAQITIRVK